MDPFGYEKLKVWQDAMTLVDDIYRQTQDFPREEIYGLSSQMRRAAVSIPSNVGEGYPLGKKAFANHLRYSIGSSFELRTQLEVARRQGYLDAMTADDLKRRLAEVSRMLDGLVKSLDRRNPDTN